jgi:predicted  nucleic acid-binding Zn-ribbon protein
MAFLLKKISVYPLALLKNGVTVKVKRERIMDDEYKNLKSEIEKWCFRIWENRKRIEKTEKEIRMIKDYLKILNRRMNTLRLAIDQVSEISRN